MAVVWADSFPTKGRQIRTAIALIAVAGAVVLAADQVSSADQKAPPKPPCFGRYFTAKQSQPFINKVWDMRLWSRHYKGLKGGSPSHKALEAWHKRLQCPAGPGHLKALRHRWRASQRQFYDHRKKMLWIKRVTPYEGPDGQFFALPWPIVWCESSGRGTITSGYYGILQSTWEQWGGLAFGPYPGAGGKKGQDIVAHKLLVSLGLSPWECASMTGYL